MSLEAISQEILSFTGTFNSWLLISVFLVLFLGEFGFAIPYLLEGIWILTAYHTVKGILSPPQMVCIWLVAVAGREAGAATFFSLVRLGSPWLMRFYNRFFGAALSSKARGESSLPSRMLNRVDLLSPFSVAFGRLTWLRIPLTITLGLKNQLKVLLIAVVFNSIAWDGVYIVVGVIGGNVQLTPIELVLYAFAGLTAVYLITFAVRRLLKAWRRRKYPIVTLPPRPHSQ